MPGPKPRLHLPYAKWPAPDQLLWQQGFQNDDPFADVRLAKATKDRCMWSWRRFLGLLADIEPEALRIPPAERLTIARVKLLAKRLAETNAPNSVAAMVEGLYAAARVMMPDHDWTWLRATKSRLHTAVPAHSPIGPAITSVQLLELGLNLMDENKPKPLAQFDVQHAVAYRDGLILAILAHEPLRPKNLISLDIVRHLVVQGERRFIIVPGAETKTGKRQRFEVPPLLVPYLTTYIDVVRPAVLRDKIHSALWISRLGGILSYGGLVKSFARISARLGVRISPHDVRDAAVTTWAIARPDQICVSRDLLYHSKLDTTNLYNRARGIEASRAYRRLITRIRRKSNLASLNS